MVRIRHDRRLRIAISRALFLWMQKKGWNQSKLAGKLDVPRQAVYRYIHGTGTPSADVLARACRLGFAFEYRGKKVSDKDFPDRKAVSAPPPFQPRLFDAQVNRDGNLRIKIASATDPEQKFVLEIKIAS